MLSKLCSCLNGVLRGGTIELIVLQKRASVCIVIHNWCCLARALSDEARSEWEQGNDAKYQEMVNNKSASFDLKEKKFSYFYATWKVRSPFCHRVIKNGAFVMG